MSLRVRESILGGSPSKRAVDLESRGTETGSLGGFGAGGLEVELGVEKGVEMLESALATLAIVIREVGQEFSGWWLQEIGVLYVDLGRLVLDARDQVEEILAEKAL